MLERIALDHPRSHFEACVFALPFFQQRLLRLRCQAHQQGQAPGAILQQCLAHPIQGGLEVVVTTDETEVPAAIQHSFAGQILPLGNVGQCRVVAGRDFAEDQHAWQREGLRASTGAHRQVIDTSWHAAVGETGVGDDVFDQRPGLGSERSDALQQLHIIRQARAHLLLHGQLPRGQRQLRGNLPVGLRIDLEAAEHRLGVYKLQGVVHLIQGHVRNQVGFGQRTGARRQHRLCRVEEISRGLPQACGLDQALQGVAMGDRTLLGALVVDELQQVGGTRQQAWQLCLEQRKGRRAERGQGIGLRELIRQFGGKRLGLRGMGHGGNLF
ncbi:hypothetical protein C1S65_08550 [Pseudomonas putida]|uniref:Uncharacterized protein n=1 Tax=Pseudomonas putida TaxID=303 RepID=A0AAD0PEU2_PSEPU|nr:hypothetical protein C1S65_08550 [Pseudomonas putida]